MCSGHANSFKKVLNSIAQLLHNFPKDQIDTKEIGSGVVTSVRDPIAFDAKDSLHMNFIVAADLLLRRTCIFL